jgi:hypothetical protein
MVQNVVMRPGITKNAVMRVLTHHFVCIIPLREDPPEADKLRNGALHLTD